MTREELEALCEPQTPEESFAELQKLYTRLSCSSWGQDEDWTALESAISILNKEIEDTSYPATVRTRRTIW